VGAKYMNQGLFEALQNLISNQLNGATAHLYTNNYTPVPGSVLANFTEMTGTGYAAQTLASWSTPVLGGDGFYTTQAAPVNFTNSGGSSWTAAYGWYYLDAGGTNVISAGLFAAPITNTAGSSIPLAPIIAAGSEY
jgi:hypothetical protein